jgi:hypothetical protein
MRPDPVPTPLRRRRADATCSFPRTWPYHRHHGDQSCPLFLPLRLDYLQCVSFHSPLSSCPPHPRRSSSSYPNLSYASLRRQCWNLDHHPARRTTSTVSSPVRRRILRTSVTSSSTTAPSRLFPLSRCQPLFHLTQRTILILLVFPLPSATRCFYYLIAWTRYIRCSIPRHLRYPTLFCPDQGMSRCEMEHTPANIGVGARSLPTELRSPMRLRG